MFSAFSNRKVSLLHDTNVKVQNCELWSQFTRLIFRAKEKFREFKETHACVYNNNNKKKPNKQNKTRDQGHIHQYIVKNG